MITNTEYKHMLEKGIKMRSILSRLTSLGINKKTMHIANESLNKESVNVVIDIRESTFYKCKQGFHPDQFKEFQGQQDRQYYYFQALGNPYHKQLQEDVKAAQNNEKKLLAIDEKARALYLDYLQQDAVEINKKIRKPLEALKTVYKLIAHTRDSKSLKFCFICYCNVDKPDYTEAGKCHRFWLIYALKELKLMELGFPSYFDLGNKFLDFDVLSSNNRKAIYSIELVRIAKELLNEHKDLIISVPKIDGLLKISSKSQDLKILISPEYKMR